jgi:hypothetical protein
MSSEKSGFIDSLVAAVTENPLAAALVGGGLLWLMTGDEKMRTAARSFTSAVSPAKESGVKAAQSTGSVFETSSPADTDLEEQLHGVGNTMGKAVDAASEAAAETASRAKERAKEGFAYAQEKWSTIADPSPAKQAYEKAQSSLADMLERQPLLLGAVGVAIGAAVAGTFRVTDLENETIGKFSDDLKDDLGTRTEAVARSLREASDTMKAEFADIGGEALDRAKQTARDAVGSARETMNP